MKFKLAETFSAGFQREVIEKAGNRAKFYLTLVFLTVAIFVVLGIRPLALTAAENRKVLLQLRRIDTLLKQKVQDLDTGIEQMSAYAPYIDILYTKIPEDILLEDYLEEVVLAAARAGFVIQRFRQQDVTEDVIPLEIELSGEISNLPNLIEALEDTARFAIVRSVRTNAEDYYTDVRVLVNIYKL